MQFKKLETERLLLRKLKKVDFEAVHSYAGCAENLIYVQWGPNTEEETHAFIQSALTLADENPITNYQFAVVLKEADKLIGGCNLYLLSEKEAEIGWLIHRNHWSKGYGTEIGGALLKFGFKDLDLHRINAHCDAENNASSRVMEKIGMRREGLFFEVRPAHKKSDKPYGDELCYAILKSDWEIRKEIEYYNSLPCEFNGFIDVPALSDNEIYLVCTKKASGNAEEKLVPWYEFAICKGGEKIGGVNLRIGYTDGLYYGGQIGYNVDEAYRGKGYAAEACRLIVPVAKAHKMEKLLITNNITNTASRRVCEKLGAKLLRVVRLPEWTDLYIEGQRYENIFEMVI